MPFAVPWTRGTPVEVARSVLQYQARSVGTTTPGDLRVDLALVRHAGSGDGAGDGPGDGPGDGEVLGTQGFFGTAYAVRRTVETGSWLGRRYQGQGIGTRVRQMVLHLLFEGLDAASAETAAYADNAASMGVTRHLGYAENGTVVDDREGERVLSRRYVLTREAWEALERPAVTLEGVGPVRAYLGLDG